MTEGPPVPFSALPLNTEIEGAYLNAWGAYGPDDELGFLNRQTDAVVAAAAKSEIKTGIRVNLNADMEFQGDKPLFGRQVFNKEICQKKPRIVHDDTWHFNTQSSTQWDGLRHFGYQQAQRFYNNTTVEDIAGTTPRSKTQPDILGIQNVARQGIFGRAILIDFARWSSPGHPGYEIVNQQQQQFEIHTTTEEETRKNEYKKGYQHFARTGIKFEWLLSALRYQYPETNDITDLIKFGDILFVRTGFFNVESGYPAISETDPSAIDRAFQSSHPSLSGEKPKGPTCGGVEFSLEILEWIWNNFSAVAGDQVAFEQLPMPAVAGDGEFSMHEVLLAGWGCPIGELFDLEALSKICVELSRWSFFLSSEVGNVKGGVASPPNAVAIF